MLKQYQRLARILSPFRRILQILLGSVAFAFTLLIFIGDHYTDQWLLPSLVSLLFLLALLLLVLLFAHDPLPARGRLGRFGQWLWQRFLVLLFTAIFLLWFFLFLRALSAIIRQLFSW